MAKFVNKGETIDYTAKAPITYGDVIVLGETCGVALDRAEKAGAVIPVAVKGRYRVPVTGALTAGNTVYWTGAAAASEKGEDGVYLGIAAEDTAGTEADVIIG